ncbi:hypothetical protein HZC30_00375 [Candidatus Woesearchaeota archaeon]|nr:hypothetical protein [Candidatus Woesearchaeota archaeon]
MEIKRYAKRLFALGTGALMLGATAMGAMAADLKDYPAFLVKDGSFNGYMVVGENAKPIDNLAMTDIAAGMKYKKAAETATTTVSGEAKKIETSTDNFNIGDAFSDIQAVDLDFEDLPTTLAKGTYINDEGLEYDFEQELAFESGVGEFALFSDTDYNDKEPTLGMKLTKGTDFITYTVDFTTQPLSDAGSSGALPDFEDTSLSILGTTYDVIDATNSSTDITLTLLGGALKDTLLLGESKTFTIGGKEYKVEVTFVDADDGAKFIVNGEATPTLAEGITRKLKDGTLIAVKEVLTSSKESVADRAEFYLGAKKLVLENGDELEVDDEDVDGVTVAVTASASGSDIAMSDIVLTWAPDDDMFITETSSAVFPVADRFSFAYKGFTTAAKEKITIENNGDDEMALNIPIKSGNAEIKLLASTNEVNFTLIGGADSDEGLKTVAGAAATTVWNATSHENMVVTYISSGATAGESYLLEITKIDTTDGVTFKDSVSSAKWEDKKAADTFSVGSATLTINSFNETTNVVNLTGGAATYFDRVISDEGMTFYLPIAGAAQSGGGYTINTTAGAATWILYGKEENNNAVLANGNLINITMDGTGDVEVSALAGAGTGYEIADTEEYTYYVTSALGTKVLFDQEPDQDTIEMEYHGEESYGNFYVMGSGASTSTVAEGTWTPVAIVDATKLDSEVADYKAQNLIVVGGPCVNTIAASLLGNPAECTTGFTAGVGLVKLFENGDKVAMLVAGYTGDDTRAAGKFVANKWKDLSGKEVNIETASGSITTVAKVEAPAVAAETPAATTTG